MKAKFFTLCGLLLASINTMLAQTNAALNHAGNINRNNNLFFIKNKGQIVDQHGKARGDIDFKLTAANVNIFIGKGKIEYQWITGMDSITTKTCRLDVQLENSDRQAKLQTGTAKEFKEQYYINNVQATATAYDKIVYKDIYPNIDWVLYIGQDHKLKYDFVVKDKGNPEAIKIKYAGASDINLDNDGNLTVTTLGGKIKEKAPYSFAAHGNQKQNIASEYVLRGNSLSFQVAPYQGTLTIDPEIDWATFYGGTEFDDLNPNYYGNLTNAVRKSAADDFGNVFIGGYTNATNNIATTGAFLQELATETDLFVAKFDNAGNRLWGTYYYGGTVYMAAMGSMTADHSGNVYFIANGTLYNENFCTPGSHQDTVSFNTDYLPPGVIPTDKMTGLVKLNANGERMWATYYGGLSPEPGWIFGKNVTVDNDNNVFLSGETNQNNDLAFYNIYNIIATDNVYQEDLNADGLNVRDAFVVKFNSEGVRQWGTYYGGNDADVPGSSSGDRNGGTGYYAVTDNSGNYYMVGNTQSTIGISTAGAHQVVSGGGGSEGYIVKLSATGGMLWSTYFGGSGYESLYSIDIDGDGNLGIMGSTSSKNQIATAASFQDTLAFSFGYSNVPFLAKFNPDGERIWGSYFNDPEGLVGNWGMTPVNMVIDNNNNYWILLTTYGGDSEFFKVGNQWDTVNPNGNNSILVKFKNNGILWSSYINAESSSINTDQLSNLFLAGNANEGSYVSANAFQNDFNGNGGTGYLLKSTICEDPDATSPSNFKPHTPVCPNATVIFSVNPGFDAYSWTLPNGWVGLSDSNRIEVLVNDQSGTVAVSGTYQCGESAVLEFPVEVINAASINFSVRNDTLFANGYDHYTWYFNNQLIPGATGNFTVLGNDGVYKAVVTTEGDCRISASYTHGGTGIGAIEQEAVKIYPNPATSYLNVALHTPARYIIYDMQGREIKSTGNNMIDIRELNNGNYLLKIVGKKGEVLRTYPFVKNSK